MRIFVLLFSIVFTLPIAAAESTLIDQRNQYVTVVLSEYVERNRVSEKMEKKQQRLMIKPKLVTFNSTLVSIPKPGEFSLAYDALSLWQSNQAMPVIDHSAFVGDRKNGPVIGVYVTQEAAKMLNSLELDKPAAFYALHIYNYAKGPRLVIVAAESL